MNLYLFKWWQRKESSRYGDFGVGSNLLGSNLGWPKTSNSLVPENIQKTLLISAQIHTCPDSNNKIYT